MHGTNVKKEYILAVVVVVVVVVVDVLSRLLNLQPFRYHRY